MRFRSSILAAAIAVLAMLAVVGCSSSSHSGATSSADSSVGGAGGTGPTSSSAPIQIGQICTCSGPLSTGADISLQAWASWVNAHGGVGGHQVHLITKDDGLNATTALTAARELITQDHVVAIVGEGSHVDVDWAPYVAKAGVPVIGGAGGNLPQYTNPDFFPVGTNQIAALYGVLQQAKLTGTKFAEVVCAEAPQCAQVITIEKAMAPSLGMTLVATPKVSATAADYTAVCQQIKESGATAWGGAITVPVVIKITTQCKQQGLQAPYIGIFEANNNFTHKPGTQGSKVVDGDFPFFDASTPATQEFQAAIKQYGSKLGDLFGPFTSWVWSSGKLFEAAVKAAPSGTITSDSLKKGLYALKNETLGGLVPALTFTPGKPTLVNCYFVYEVGIGKFTLPQGLKTSCADDSIVDSVVAKLS